MTVFKRNRFQSTLPTRGSDDGIELIISHNQTDFNPRSPRGGATCPLLCQACLGGISIHAPHEGERQNGARGSIRRQRFQSTLPTRGSDPPPIIAKRTIRAFQSTLPTRGSDKTAIPSAPVTADFNPRSPRGGATAEKCICIQHFREFAEYYPLRHGDARCIAPQDCIIQAFFGAKKRCFYVRLCFALKNKGVRG